MGDSLPRVVADLREIMIAKPPPSCDDVWVDEPVATVPGIFLQVVAAFAQRFERTQSTTARGAESPDAEWISLAEGVLPDDPVPGVVVEEACARVMAKAHALPDARDFLAPAVLGFYAPVVRHHFACGDGLLALFEQLASGETPYLRLPSPQAQSRSSIDVRVDVSAGSQMQARRPTHMPKLLFAMAAALVELYGYSARGSLRGEAMTVAWYTRPWWGTPLAILATIGAVFAGLLPLSWGLKTGILAVCFLLGLRLVGLPTEASRKSRAAFERARVLEHAMRAIETRGTAGQHPTLFGGRYRVEGVLGSGATSVVYQARDLASGERVAIKALRASSSSDVSSRDRLRREADALSLSWHPNVVECKGHVERGGTPFVVLEYIDGESLEAAVKTSTLSVKATAELGLTLLNATAAMHGSGVIHRDIKPANVILRKAARKEDGKCMQVKIIDFGIAQIEWEEMRLTGGGSRLGTPLYMPPEHLGAAAQSALGTSTLLPDRQADLYAIAVTLMECWLGPASVSSREERLTELARRERKGADAAFATILARALSPLPEARYADADSFADALKGLNEAKAERQDD
jgi:tRNA A-37 threonylcarbamoyl transferase component Bud32